MGVIQLNGVMNMISTKGRYALRVMIDLAQNDHGGYIPLKDIAERQEISKKYLEIIIAHFLNRRNYERVCRVAAFKFTS